MNLITQGPKGTQDFLPKDTAKWQIVEEIMRSEAGMNGFGEVRTPVFEHTELFLRGVGDTTDVVEKQMYTFEDKGGRSITLRPEGTAGVVRAMLQSGIYNEGYPVKLYYVTSCYRYEKPQAGRVRELHQFGVEMFGAAEPVADAQVIALGMSVFRRLGLEDVGLTLNSIGCPECRREYHKALKDYFSAHKEKLCETCLSRLERNPMRILDCKSPLCGELTKDAPKITDYLCGDCRDHFAKVRAYLDDLNIPYEIDASLVRGLDYYTRTVFEFPSKRMGYALGGGGRYDGLVEEMGGKPTAGLGFGLGMDRIMLALDDQNVEFPKTELCEVYIASLGEAAQKKAFLLTDTLHSCGVSADCDLCSRGLKAQLKYADKIGAAFTIVIGDSELEAGKAEIKNMKTGEKTKISIVGESFIDDYITSTAVSDDMEF